LVVQTFLENLPPSRGPWGTFVDPLSLQGHRAAALSPVSTTHGYGRETTYLDPPVNCSFLPSIGTPLRSPMTIEAIWVSI